MMILMTEQLTKNRQDDRLGFKKNFRSNNKESLYVGLRPASSTYCAGSLVRARLMRKHPHIIRISNSIKNKANK